MHLLNFVLCVALPATVLTRSVARIIGGSTVPDSTTYPFMASLRYFGEHSCGAALIGSGLTIQKAVTAAHCIGNPFLYTSVWKEMSTGSTGPPAAKKWKQGVLAFRPGAIRSSYELMVASNDRLCRLSDCSRRLLSSAVRHPDFVDAGFLGYPNDIAVITISIPPITVDASTRPISLADSNTNPATVTLMGWGRLSAYGDMAEYLQSITGARVLTEAECNAAWSSQSVIDYTRQICVQSTDAGVGPCNGDSGSPMIIGTTAVTYRLVGVMSWTGIECDTNRPTVYTRVSHYADWINSQ